MFDTVPIVLPRHLDQVALHDLAGVLEDRAHLVSASRSRAGSRRRRRSRSRSRRPRRRGRSDLCFAPPRHTQLHSSLARARFGDLPASSMGAEAYQGPHYTVNWEPAVRGRRRCGALKRLAARPGAASVCPCSARVVELVRHGRLKSDCPCGMRVRLPPRALAIGGRARDLGQVAGAIRFTNEQSCVVNGNFYASL